MHFMESRIWVIRKVMDFFVRERECLSKLLDSPYLDVEDISDLRDTYGNTLLHIASEAGDVEAVKMLLDVISDVENDRGATPLHVAANGEVARLLIKYVYINEKDRDGRTPLHYAALSGRLDVVKVLIEQEDIFIDATDNEGNTPLMLALKERHIQVAKLLIESGAIINIRNNNGDTPLHFAVLIGDAELVRMMLERGADVNAQNADGDTPLHVAVRRGYVEIVKLLLSNNAKILRNKRNETPLHIAAMRCRDGLVNCFEIFEMLFKHSETELKKEVLSVLLNEEQRKVLALYGII